MRTNEHNFHPAAIFMRFVQFEIENLLLVSILLKHYCSFDFFNYSMQNENVNGKFETEYFTVWMTFLRQFKILVIISAAIYPGNK